MSLDDFDFDLPPELIAQFPLASRSASRLLHLDKTSGAIVHSNFKELPNLITAKDLLVFNDTKVIPARLFATKPTGGKVEILVERISENNKILAQIKTSKALKNGAILLLDTENFFIVSGRQDNFFILLLNANLTIAEILTKFGQIPLPPYIEHQPTESDKDRYQTIYAKHDGAVAAPTAGLHFDQELMLALAQKNIRTAFLTLHVGAGTFQPIRTQNFAEHKMHKEYINVSEAICQQITTTKQNGGRIIAVGTTSARALESASLTGKIKPYNGDTDIFIYPGYKFNCVDALITNFHLPKTSLLLIISALAGKDNIIHAYQEAIQQKYRFFSYGDSMVII